MEKRFSLAQSKHKDSCITCKIRKKRCSKDHPICADCKRLNRHCVWINDDMTIHQIKEIRNRVQEEERAFKVKRKLEIQTRKINGYNTGTKKKQKISNTDGDEMESNNLFEDHEQQTVPKGFSKFDLIEMKANSTITATSYTHSQTQNITSFPTVTTTSLDQKTNDASLQHKQQQQQYNLIKQPEHINSLDLENIVRVPTPLSSNLLYISQNSPSLYPSSPKNNWESPKNNWDNLALSPGNGFQFFDNLNSFMEQTQLKFGFSPSDKITPVIDDNLEVSSESMSKESSRDSSKPKSNISKTAATTTSSTVATVAKSPLSFLRQNSKSPNSGLSPLFLSLDDFENIPFANLYAPKISSPLSIDRFGLDEMGFKLLDHYTNCLSNIVSIVPAESNFYVNLYLPMASTNPGVLYGLVSWSASYLGKGYEDQAQKYIEKAQEYMDSTPLKSNEDQIERLATCMILIGSEICRGDVSKWGNYLKLGSRVINDRGGIFKFNQNKDQRFLISSFVYHDVLASSVGERGTYFSLQDYENFLVHQIGLGVDPLQGIVKPLFNIIAEISSFAFETKKLLNLSCKASDSKGLILELEEASSSEEDEEDDDEKNDGGEEEEEDDDDDDEEEHKFMGGSPELDSDSSKKSSRYSNLMYIMQKTSTLEAKINAAKPDPHDLESFPPKELELQLTLFELFQYTAKLHLRQSVLRLNPSSLETQFLLCELLKCLDIVLKSPVESSLCFPMFIAGLSCTTKKNRKKMIKRFDGLVDRCCFQSIAKAKQIVMKIWEMDRKGTRCIDWYEVVKTYKWDMSFA